MEETKGDPLNNLLDTLGTVGIRPPPHKAGSTEDVFKYLLELYKNVKDPNLSERIRSAIGVAESGKRAKAVRLFRDLEALRNSTVPGPN